MLMYSVFTKNTSETRVCDEGPFVADHLNSFIFSRSKDSFQQDNFPVYISWRQKKRPKQKSKKTKNKDKTTQQTNKQTNRKKNKQKPKKKKKKKRQMQKQNQSNKLKKKQNKQKTKAKNHMVDLQLLCLPSPYEEKCGTCCKIPSTLCSCT